MTEPDGVMNGPDWPDDWQTGWVTWRYSDLTGLPLEGSIGLQLSVARAVSPDTHTTVLGTQILVPLDDGKPSGPSVVLNADNIPCIEVPLGNDPDIIPTGIQLIVSEKFLNVTGATFRKDVSADNTLDNPLWLSGDLTSVAAQPGVVTKLVWVVDLESSGAPVEAQVGDWVLFKDTGNLYEIGA